MKRTLAFFNNKGGVGKTTLACNFAHYAATELGLSTVVIDLDPQANSTQLLLPENEWERIYDDTTTSANETIIRAFSDILEGDSTVVADVKLTPAVRFSVDLIAGHPSLSRVEDHLSRGWIDLQGGLVGGARRTNWMSTLRASLEHDLAVVDLGPSLGALNRSALVGSSNFVTPVAADLFSLYALENIGEWIRSWIDEYRESMMRTTEKNPTSSSMREFPMDAELRHGYIGYTVQQYVARSSGGKIRPTAAYDRYKEQIPARAAELRQLAAKEPSDFNLGTVPNMFSMVALAQNAHAPISSLSARDDVRGAQVYQQERYSEQLGSIFVRMAENMGVSR